MKCCSRATAGRTRQRAYRPLHATLESPHVIQCKLPIDIVYNPSIPFFDPAFKRVSVLHALEATASPLTRSLRCGNDGQLQQGTAAEGVVPISHECSLVGPGHLTHKPAPSGPLGYMSLMRRERVERPVTELLPDTDPSPSSAWSQVNLPAHYKSPRSGSYNKETILVLTELTVARMLASLTVAYEPLAMFPSVLFVFPGVMPPPEFLSGPLSFLFRGLNPSVSPASLCLDVLICLC